MLNTNLNRRRPSPSEEGYILIWVIFLMVLLTLWLSVAIPRTTKAIQRDREIETMHRGKQYMRAVQLYYRKFHAYPPNADALSNTNEMRFLRKKYIDPTTGKDDWKIIRFGQAKTQTLGFFGQPLAGAGSAGGSLMAGNGPTGGSGIGGGSGSSPGGSSIGGSSIGSPGSGPSSISSSGSSGTPAPAGSGTGGTGPTGSSSDTGLTGQTFGGAGIIGFSPAAPRPSILIYKKKSQYNEWEFVYDPLVDMRTIAGNTGMIGQPAGSNTNGAPGLGSTPTSSTPIPTPGPASPSPGSGSDPGNSPTPPQQ